MFKVYGFNLAAYKKKARKKVHSLYLKRSFVGKRDVSQAACERLVNFMALKMIHSRKYKKQAMSKGYANMSTATDHAKMGMNSGDLFYCEIRQIYSVKGDKGKITTKNKVVVNEIRD